MEEHNDMNGSEALFAFAGWLSSRDQPVTFSQCHDMAPIADLIKQFCERNKLEPVREDKYPRNIIQPVESG